MYYAMKSRTRFENIYEWTHDDYCGCTSDITYVVEEHGMMCIIRDFYTTEWYNNFTRSTEQTLEFLIGTVDHESKSIRLHPGYVIDTYNPHLSHKLKRCEKHFRGKYETYRVTIDPNVDIDICVIYACLKYANLTRKQMNVIEQYLQSN